MAAGEVTVSPKKTSRQKSTTNEKTTRNNSATDASPAESGPAHDAGVFESLGRKIDEVPQVRAAEEAVRQAHEKLAQARDAYEQARVNAADELSNLREKNVGDLVDGATDYVRRHPGQGVLVAALCGFFLGRLFRR